MKLIVSGIIALIILSCFSLFYYNNGIRKASQTGATDYVWENKFWSLGYEGFSHGSYDENGYNNSGTMTSDNVDVLLMGSSQMNAYNVLQEYSTGYRLNSLLSESYLGYTLYNIGIEGHDFYICSDNLDDAIKEYKPNKYVIMETRISELSIESMKSVLDNARQRTSAYDTGIIHYLQRIPYFRLFYRQIRDIGLLNITKVVQNNNTEINDEVQSSNNVNDEYEVVLDDYIQMLENKADEAAIKLIVFYIPPVEIQNDGTVKYGDNEYAIDLFSIVCQKHNIEFLDLSDDFSQYYNENFKLVYGFSNTEAGVGHLNKYGHELVAERLYETILEIEDR
jgi:hypothetical protein